MTPTRKQGILFFALGAALLTHSLVEHYHGPGVRWSMSPYLFPLLISIFLILLASSLILGREQGNGKTERGETFWRGVAVFLASTLVYYIALPFLHFPAATILYLAFLLRYLGEVRYLVVGGIAAGGALFLWLLFGLLLGVRLP